MMDRSDRAVLLELTATRRAESLCLWLAELWEGYTDRRRELGGGRAPTPKELAAALRLHHPESPLLERLQAVYAESQSRGSDTRDIVEVTWRALDELLAPGSHLSLEACRAAYASGSRCVRRALRGSPLGYCRKCEAARRPPWVPKRCEWWTEWFEGDRGGSSDRAERGQAK